MSKKGVSTAGVYIVGVLLAIALIGTASDLPLTGEVSRQLKSRGLGTVERADSANVEVYNLDQAISEIDEYYVQGILSMRIEKGTVRQQQGGIFTFQRSTSPVKSYRIAGIVAYENVQDIIMEAASKADLRIRVVRGSGNPAVTLLVDSPFGGLIAGDAGQDEKEEGQKQCIIYCSCQKCVTKEFACFEDDGTKGYVSPQPECTKCQPTPPIAASGTYKCGTTPPDCKDVCEKNEEFNSYPEPLAPSDGTSQCRIESEKECKRRDGRLGGSTTNEYTRGMRKI